MIIMCDVHVGDSTPLMEAASGGYADIVKLLIKHGANVNAKSRYPMNSHALYPYGKKHVYSTLAKKQ